MRYTSTFDRHLSDRQGPMGLSQESEKRLLGHGLRKERSSSSGSFFESAREKKTGTRAILGGRKDEQGFLVDAAEQSRVSC